MLNEEHERLMLAYLSGLMEDKTLHSAEDLCAMETRDLLHLAQRVDDSALGLFVQILKTTGQGGRLFERLMGDHEEENRAMVDAFFNRYLRAVLSDAQEGRDFNPLEVYLPPSAFDDLAFVQTRQAFFLRQTIGTINAYLDLIFSDNKGHLFLPDEQEKAWNYFWGKVLSR
jgi:hypothetical protein